MIMLTADDYALNADVDRAVTALSDARRLSATSVMTNMPRWPAAAAELAAHSDHLALGLHVNFTEAQPLSDDARRTLTGATGNFRPLRDLITRALLGRLPPAVIAAEIRAQLDAFTKALGRLPDYVDGHQHVHVLPGVRDGLFATLNALEWTTPPLVRTPLNQGHGPRDPLSAAPKRAIAGVLATGFRTRLARENLPTNDTFAGFSTFRPGSAAESELSRALDTTGAGLHLVMCHPAVPATCRTSSPDPLAQRRIDEFHALMAMPGLPDRIWHPTRNPNGAIDWSHVTGATIARSSARSQENAIAEMRSS